MKAILKIKSQEIEYPIIMQSSDNGDIVVFTGLTIGFLLKSDGDTTLGTYSNLNIKMSCWYKFDGTLELSND